ncbi:MAG: GntR family transcriptional regulator [Roseiarcus sp.]|jgi:DNA-binding GntR family transcriptional regulator
MSMARKASASEDKGLRAAVAIDRGRSVPPQVYDLLRERILTMELEPGESINERRLADWLGVSRTPIREAINRLSANGLIAIVPNVGTSVSLINADKVREFNLIRTSLESLIVRLAAERFDERGETILLGLIERQVETTRAPKLVENILVDTEFHRAIAGIAGLSATWAILQHVMDEILRVRHLSVRRPRPLTEPIAEHRAIVAALRTKDPERSDRAMKAHLDASAHRILEALAQYPGYLEHRT